MTSRERVHAVLEGRAPDKVPLHHISISSRVASRLLGRTAFVGGGINQWREAVALWRGADAHAEFLERTRRDALAIAVALDQDLVRPAHWRLPRRPAERLDEFTFRYESGGGAEWEVRRLDPEAELYPVVARSPRPELGLEDLDRVVADAEEAAEAYEPVEAEWADVKYALEAVGREREVRANAASLAIPADSPVWLEACLLRPDLVGRYLDTQVHRALKHLDALVPIGARLIFGGGDFASDQGPIYSPAVFRRLLLPRLKRISEACRRHGLYHLFGTDGNVWAVAEDLYRQSDIDGHYEFDRHAGMRGVEVHARYPHIAMIGGMSSHTLHMGTPAEVAAETRACLAEARQTGKMIAGASNLIVPETPARNLDAMLDAIATFRC